MPSEDQEKEFLDIGEPLELQAIKNILSSRSFLVSVIENIRPEFFENFTAKMAVIVIKEHFVKFSDVPTMDIIKTEAKRYLTPKDDEALFHRELEQIANLNVQNEEYLRIKILEHCQFQALRRAILLGITLLQERKEDYKQKINDSIKKALSITDHSGAGLDYFKNPQERLTTETQYKRHIKTGLEKLNTITGGGWSIEDTPLVIVVAPTGFGKSIMLCKFGAMAVLSGYKVVHITHELSETRTAARYDSLFTSIGQKERLSKEIFNEKAITIRTKLEEVIRRIGIVKQGIEGDLRIKEFPTKTCTPNQMRAYLEKVRDFEDFKPDIVINDYMDLMLANHNAYADNDYAMQKRISEELRAVAQEYHVPIITASQTNRTGAEKEMVLNTDIAESFGKVMTADMVLTMYQSSEEKMVGLSSLYVAKFRNGPSGVVIPIKIDYEMMNIYEPAVGQTQQGATG